MKTFIQWAGDTKKQLPLYRQEEAGSNRPERRDQAQERLGRNRAPAPHRGEESQGCRG